jgi:hypothetical protein
LSLHLQWTPTHRPRINENQERLIEEEHAIVCISIGWWKSKAQCKERPCSMDYELSPIVNWISFLLQVCLLLLTSKEGRIKTYIGMFNLALCNIKTHSYESSIIQTWLCVLQNSSMGDGVL